MENNSFYFWLSVISNICQLESYEMLIKDAKNDELMNYLSHQDNDYLLLKIDCEAKWTDYRTFEERR
jgi:hypothetical protein